MNEIMIDIPVYENRFGFPWLILCCTLLGFVAFIVCQFFIDSLHNKNLSKQPSPINDQIITCGLEANYFV